MRIYNIILGLFVKDWMTSLYQTALCTVQTLLVKTTSKLCMRIVANAICECLIHSAKDCIPVHQHKRVAGWNDSASFLKQFKYHGHTAPVIDGVSGDPQIAGLWSTKFKELYNHCNPSTRNSLQKQLNS